jgi:hypothetical protein
MVNRSIETVFEWFADMDHVAFMAEQEESGKRTSGLFFIPNFINFRSVHLHQRPCAGFEISLALKEGILPSSHNVWYGNIGIFNPGLAYRQTIIHLPNRRCP